jgi:glycosyltransferase involved in cell wall biosynthesis
MRILDILMKRMYDSAEKVVAVSKGVATDMYETLSLEDEPKVIYNPVVTPSLFHQANEPLNDPWFNPDSPPVVLSAGRLQEEKDFTTLINAFVQLRKEIPSRLVILGKGDKKKKLKRTAKEYNVADDVRFPGFVDNPYKYMKRADVFALSSKREGLPTVLIEAMACGTPVVSTDCPSGPAEILEGGKWGYLVPVGDPDKLCAAISKAFDDPINGKPRSEDFRLENAVESYLNIFTLQYTDQNDRL